MLNLEREINNLSLTFSKYFYDLYFIFIHMNNNINDIGVFKLLFKLIKLIYLYL